MLLGLPALGLSLRRSVIVEPSGALLTFSRRQYSTLHALAETLCPGGPGLPSASDVNVAGQLDALFARMHPSVGADLAAALDLLENALAGALLDQRFQTFTACSAEVRLAVLEDWRSSAITVRRAVFKALRGFVVATYWGSPEAGKSIGYSVPDYSSVPSPPPFEEYIAAVEAAEAKAIAPDALDATTAPEEAP